MFMKKIMLAVSALLILGLAMTSCRKCETCTAYYSADNTVYTQQHECGRSLTIKTWEDSFKSSYDWGDTYVECEKD